MSTQDGSSGIPFTFCNEQQTFRLLELPPSALELITSENSPNLVLKSAAPGISDGSNQPPANAVFCTNNQTFQVRQVQSSNSVFVVQPSENGVHGVSTDGISAIAQCAATLELIPISPSATSILRETLPIYTGAESIQALGSQDVKGRKTVLDDMPFSLGEFDKAWRSACAFELEGKAWMPAASVLASVWRSIISAATLRSLNLGDGFSVRTLEGGVEEDGHPRILLNAVIDRLRCEHEDLTDGYEVLDRVNCVLWVGVTLLSSQQDSTDGMRLSEFIQDWQNHLPESWRTDAKIELLKGQYTQLSKDRIAFNDTAMKPRDLKESASANPSGKGGRNWHHKFKDVRR